MHAFASLRRAVRAATPALALGTAALTAALAACSDSPTSPASTATAGPAHYTGYTTGYTTGGYTTSYTTYPSTTTSGSTLVSSTALMRTTPLAAPITRSITLRATGGTLQIPEAGLVVTIPRGAVGDTTATFSVTALAGNAVAYDFQPHGAKFLTQLKVNQSLAGTSWAGNTGMMKLSAGYFASNTQVNTYTGAAQLNEQISGTVAGGTYQFDIAHFSGYLVCWNRY